MHMLSFKKIRMMMKRSCLTKAFGNGIRPMSLVAYVLIVLISVELGCQVAFRLIEGCWIFATSCEKKPPIFERHPYLIGTPIPGIDVTEFGTQIVHNAMGFRGTEFNLQKKPGVVRIVTLGASTTYCTGVTQGQTWPELLAHDLGDQYEVINLGVPGYGTVENLIQTAFLISDLAPDIAIYYEGWSDIRNMHIKDLKPDYSNFHPRELYWALLLARPAPRGVVVTLYYLREFLAEYMEVDSMAKYRIQGDGDQFTAKVDQRALSLYMRNLRSIIALNRSLGVIPVFIPQLLNYAALTADGAYGWIPYIKDKDLKVGMAAYNDGMKTVAKEQSVDFVDEVLQTPFVNDDFWDNGHFNQSGTAKFAKIVAQHILARNYLRNSAEIQESR